MVPDVNRRSTWSDGSRVTVVKRCVGVGRERGRVRRVVDDEDAAPGRAEVESVEQPLVTPFGDDHLALGMEDVALQPRAAPGGVDAHDRPPEHGRGTEPHGEVGHVVEQHADVRCAGDPHRVEERGARRALLHELGVGP